VDTVNRVVPQLIAHGRVPRPYLGVSLDDRLSSVVTRRMGVEGVLLRDVEPNSPAASVGLRGTHLGRGSSIVPGDIVQEIDGRKVRTSDDLLGRLGNAKPGDTVTLLILRDGQPLKVIVRLRAAE
jgi:S1-C subfamily serine protease